MARETAAARKVREIKAEIASTEEMIAEERAALAGPLPLVPESSCRSPGARREFIAGLERTLELLRALLPLKEAEAARAAKRNAAARERSAVLSSLGLKRTRSGGWE